MRRLWMLVGLAVLAAACTDEKTPLAPTAVATPTPPVPIPSLPTTVPGVLTIALPISVDDAPISGAGMTPFGFHSAGHAETGHTGWDFDLRAGAPVRAAAAGIILEVNTDQASGRFTVQIEHVAGNHFYRTIYSSLATLASADIAAGESVIAGQLLGTAAGVSHFQLDDFEYYRDIPAPNAVSPEPFLSAAARGQLDHIWSRAVFAEELVEPFLTNPRDLLFPASRTWTRAGGDGPAGIRFIRPSARAAEYNYELLAESGTVIEAGTVAINIATKPYPLIALTSPTAVRLGLYDVVSNEMRLALGLPGLPRPTDIATASIYRTR
jgi:hypothetical protein